MFLFNIEFKYIYCAMVLLEADYFRLRHTEYFKYGPLMFSATEATIVSLMSVLQSVCPSKIKTPLTSDIREAERGVAWWPSGMMAYRQRFG